MNRRSFRTRTRGKCSLAVVCMVLSAQILPALAGAQTPQIPDPGKSVPNQDVYHDFLAKLVDLIDEKAGKPDGTKSKRETAFEALAAIDFAMYGGLIVLPVGTGLTGAGVGAVTGAIVGGLAGAPVADGGGATILLGMGVGGAGGGAIGTGVGAVASVGGMVTATVISVALMLYINEHYPPEQASSGTGAFRIASVGGGTYAAQAGPYESLVIHMVDVVFNSTLNRVAAMWDATPGLTAQQRAYLTSHPAVRPFIQQISYIQTQKRISPNSPVAQPLSGFLKEATLLLGADTEAVERLWISALGVGSIAASVRDGKLSVTMPAVLTSAGMPSPVKADLPSVAVKVGGTGGIADPYLSASASPGPFDLVLGAASLISAGANANRIKVSYSVRKGSSLGAASLKFRWNGPEATLAAFSPTTASTATVDIYYRPDGLGLAFDKVTVNSMTVSLNLPPGLPAGLPGLSELVQKLSAGLHTDLDNMISTSAPYAAVLGGMKTSQAQSLRKSLDATPQRYGVFGVSGVQALLAQSGTLKARVRALVVDSAVVPNLSATARQVASALQAPTFRRRNIVFTIPHLPALSLKP